MFWNKGKATDMFDDIIDASAMAAIADDEETVRKNIVQRDVDWAWEQCETAASHGAFEVSVMCGNDRTRYLNIRDHFRTAADACGITVSDEGDTTPYPESEEEFEECVERGMCDFTAAYAVRLSWKDAKEGTQAYGLRKKAQGAREASRPEMEHVIAECMETARYGNHAAYPVIHNYATKVWLRELGYEIGEPDDQHICEVRF